MSVKNTFREGLKKSAAVVSELIHGVRRNWFLVWISSWMAAVYAERILIDLMTRKGKSFGEAISSSVLIVFFLLQWVLFLWAFKLEDEDVPRIKAKLGRLLKEYRGDLWSTGIFIGAALYYFLKAFFREPLGPVLLLVRHWLEPLLADVVNAFVSALPALILLVVLYAFYRAVARLFSGDDPVYVAFREWTLTLIPILFALFLYIAIYRFWIFDSLSEEVVKFEAWQDFIKDSSIYTLVAIVLVQGLYRYRKCYGAFKHPYAKWLGFAAFVWGTGTLTALALYFDIRGLQEMATVGSLQFPDRSVHPLVKRHVLFRDWGMLLPLISTMFIWLAGEMSTAWSVVGAGRIRKQDLIE